MNDLERSVDDKLIALLATDDRVITAAEIDGVLEQIGTVETGTEPVTEAAAAPPKRRLRRTKEGQWFAGVCNGLAEYSEISVDWVRTLFIFGTFLTGGLLAVVYIAMAFVLPVEATR
ncbi:MAG TPA: PspC domain-containing protein, partial [Candidatus Limnocylindrales bacterium]